MKIANKWSRKELLNSLDEFKKLYEDRPINLIGRFSEWNENTTLETIYNRAMQLKEFYSSNENNHKIIL